MLLNSHIHWKALYIHLKVDGHGGDNTKEAIKRFQREMMNRKNPDGRVDPNGSTLRFLTMNLKPVQEAAIQKQVREGRMVAGAPVVSAKTITAAIGLKGQTVVYSGVAAGNQIVSEYSMRVIKMALKESGTMTAVITSTIRTLEEQAAAMLKNAKGGAARLQAQKKLYGSKKAGQAALKVYEDNMSDTSKSDGDIIALMVAKLEELEKEGVRISKHCVTKAAYEKRNVIDIGLNSMKARNPGFDQKKFTAVLKKLLDEGYLEVLLDETELSNSCWHIEIIPNKMELAKYEGDTILNAVAYC